MSTVPPHRAMPTAQRLCMTLRRLGWKQADIARHVQTTQATISRIASGRHRDPGHLVYTRLCDLVNSLEGFKELDDYDVGQADEVGHERVA